jgi:hypothetical protein
MAAAKRLSPEQIVVKLRETEGCVAPDFPSILLESLTTSERAGVSF